MSTERTVTLTLTETELQNLMTALNSASVAYSAKASRKNADPQYVRVWNLFNENTNLLWAKCYQLKVELMGWDR